MAYTEFRKSYGDFEIIIPAVDFSRLFVGVEREYGLELNPLRSRGALT